MRRLWCKLEPENETTVNWIQWYHDVSYRIRREIPEIQVTYFDCDHENNSLNLLLLKSDLKELESWEDGLKWWELVEKKGR